MDVDISHLRQQLPEYLTRVRQGERVRIMSRGRVVAELVPPSNSADGATEVRERLEGGVLRHDDPNAPVLGDNERHMHRE